MAKRAKVTEGWQRRVIHSQEIMGGLRYCHNAQGECDEGLLQVSFDALTSIKPRVKRDR